MRARAGRRHRGGSRFKEDRDDGDEVRGVPEIWNDDSDDDDDDDDAEGEDNGIEESEGLMRCPQGDSIKRDRSRSSTSLTPGGDVTEKNSINGLTFDELKEMKTKAARGEVESRMDARKAQDAKWNGARRQGDSKLIRRAGNSSTRRSKPLELSCAIASVAPSTLRLRPGHSRARGRDPRFSGESGSLNIDLFARSYDFLDTLRHEEKQELRQTAATLSRKIRQRRDDTDADDDDSAAADENASDVEELRRDTQQKLKRLESQDVHRRHLGREATLKSDIQKRERSAIMESGKKDYFHSKSKLRAMLKEESHKAVADNRRKMATRAAKDSRRLNTRERGWAPDKRRKT